MAKIVQRRHQPQSNRPKQTAAPALRGQKALSPVVKRQHGGKSK
jgi:hypothetical protein